MDQLHLMQVYVAVAEEEGFAAGARKLGLSPPAVTRAIAALEDKLKVKLLNRTTRYVRTTESGERYLIDARRILQEVEMANEAAVGINAKPRGRLAITAPVLFGKMFVMPAIIEYLQHYPDTEVETVFLDRVVNLLEEGLDVGIRIGELPDSSMRALKVGTVRMILCASPEYIKRKGIPQDPNDLINHDSIFSRAVNANSEWFFDYNKQAQKIKLKPRLIVNTNDAAIEAAKSGFGITRLLSYQVAPLLASGELKILLESYEPKPSPIHIVHREGHLTSTKVRSFIDLIAKQLRSNQALN
ncbi:MAG: DNA-binding transcriptional LysR family regulator [Alteromonadaceae bacterium]|jgi:DNA-binding transcriptional LysR family regulator